MLAFRRSVSVALDNSTTSPAAELCFSPPTPEPSPYAALFAYAAISSAISQISTQRSPNSASNPSSTTSSATPSPTALSFSPPLSSQAQEQGEEEMQQHPYASQFRKWCGKDCLATPVCSLHLRKQEEEEDADEDKDEDGEFAMTKKMRQLSDSMLSPNTLTRMTPSVPRSRFELGTGVTVRELRHFLDEAKWKREKIWNHCCGKDEVLTSVAILSRIFRIGALHVRRQKEKTGQDFQEVDKEAARVQMRRLAEHVANFYLYKKRFVLPKRQFLRGIPASLRHAEDVMLVEDAPAIMCLAIHGMADIVEDSEIQPENHA